MYCIFSFFCPSSTKDGEIEKGQYILAGITKHLKLGLVYNPDFRVDLKIKTGV